MAKVVVWMLLACVVLGCASSERYFRLEELGEDWHLDIEEVDGSRFQAKWVPGENRSMRLVNITDADRKGFTAVNTLYLEVDEKGNVVEGWLKRFVVRNVERRSAEDGATWWRVLEGWCRLDEHGRGTLNVRCQGSYDFAGEVIPMEGLEVKRS